jgi:hypothetical protein
MLGSKTVTMNNTGLSDVMCVVRWRFNDVSKEPTALFNFNVAMDDVKVHPR